ncbi:MAG: hypothetical protein KDC05_10495 [Bacteroidales bacterium]|nr:hypothetical protein [Bacteroidales bacterium]
MKTFWFFLLSAMILYILISLFKTQTEVVMPETELSDGYIREVTALAARSLESNDVPVGAVVMYDGKIIG